MSSVATDLRPRAASLSMVGGMVIIGCIDNAIAPMSEHIGLWQFYLVRAAMSLPLIALASLAGLGTLRPLRLWAVALRGSLMAVAMLFYFGALAFVTLPQALAGLFTSPIFILLITVFGLKQRIGPWRIGAVALGFVGIMLVINPWAEVWQVAAVMPVIGGLLYACASIATRTICSGESVLSMLASLFVAQAVIGLIALLILPPGSTGDFITRGWVWPMASEAVWLLAIQAVGSVLGVGLLIRAYALGEASYVAVFEYSIFLFGAFFAWVFFAQVPTPMAALGIALVALAGIVIARRTSDD